MPKQLRNRLLLLAVLTLVALYCAVPSLPIQYPDWWPHIAPTNGVRLGLDLQGGMHLILKVNMPRAVQSHLELTLPPSGQRFANNRLSPQRPNLQALAACGCASRITTGLPLSSKS